ncbi:hypothetical protein [Sphingomonas sp.]|uniref:hypothetical protein n=1 Tax=Sphingomonas sp. TaxID=28214 RepID=UPI0031E2041C
MIVGWCAALATIGGALCLYASAPHQVLVRHDVAGPLCRVVGALLLLTALVLLLTVQGPATAVFTWATGAMLVWSIVPAVVRWWRFRREAAR